MKNYYQILEVASDASQDIIKDQYRFLVHAWHPDKFPNSKQKIKAEEKLKEINEAYEVLNNPIKRAQYDNSFAACAIGVHILRTISCATGARAYNNLSKNTTKTISKL